MDPISKKALLIVRTPKKDMAEKFGDLFKKLPKAQKEAVPLHQQLWFRLMVDRIANGQRIYEGRATHLGLYYASNGIDPEPVVCNHQNCRHREALHAYEVPAGSGHRSKKGLYVFLRNKKGISVIGV